MKFAKELKQARKEAGLSQTDVFKRLKIPQQAQNRWENGKTVPPEWNQRLILWAIGEIERGEKNNVGI